MTDFDEVLERLLSDPSFSAALASDPDAALKGYTLSGDERDLLRSQLVAGPGEDRAVESRTTKSGVVGLLGPVAAAFGVASGGLGSGSQTLGTAAAGSQSMGGTPDPGSFGSAPQPSGQESMGGVGGPAESMGFVGGSQQGLGPAVTTDSMGAAPEATDYHTRVDVDGDGSWDAHTAYERSDGGVDIHADVDGDGVTDFVGHDYDRDGLVDTAEFDNDRDGIMETRMYDDTGDGWLDRAEAIPADGESQTFGPAPTSL